MSKKTQKRKSKKKIKSTKRVKKKCQMAPCRADYWSQGSQKKSQPQTNRPQLEKVKNNIKKKQKSREKKKSKKGQKKSDLGKLTFFDFLKFSDLIFFDFDFWD